MWSNYLVGIAVFVVACVLVAGLINMLRGGSPNLSQKLMRWRVGLQFLAILIIMGVLFFRR
jgi:Hypoxia induced protein conserved region